MPADGPFANERIVVTAFLVEHPKGLFLFDTGFSPEPKKLVDRFRPVYMRPIDEALRAAGRSIADIAAIANCHFHPDHAGGNHHFAGVPIFVQKAEVEHARSDAEYTYLAEPWPGIRIIPSQGHSPGHQSLVLETAQGRAILAGQALNFSSDYARHRYSHELARAGEPHGPYPDWIATFYKLDPARVYFAHDRAARERSVESEIR